MLSFQAFLNDQARRMSRVARYCEQAKLSRPVNAYLYTYDSNRDFLVCRNHKVTQFPETDFRFLPILCHFITIPGCLHDAFADIPAPAVRDSETHVR